MCVHILAHCCMQTYILCKYQYLLHYSELHRIHRSYMCKYYFQITPYDLLIFTIHMAMKIQLFIFHFIFLQNTHFNFGLSPNSTPVGTVQLMYLILSHFSHDMFMCNMQQNKIYRVDGFSQVPTCYTYCYKLRLSPRSGERETVEWATGTKLQISSRGKKIHGSGGRLGS